MKKITLLIVILLLTACAGKKNLTNTHNTTLATTDTTRISTTTTTNLAVHDTIFISVPGDIVTGQPECDSICKVAFQKYLAGINTKKKSGGNGYGIYYDKYLNAMVMYNELAETVNMEKEKESKSTKDAKDVLTVYVPKMWTPFWMQILAGIGGATIIACGLWIGKKLRTT